MSEKRPQGFPKAAQLGYTMLATILLFTGVGYWADKHFKTSDQRWTLTGILFGLGFCGYEVWKLLKEMNQKD